MAEEIAKNDELVDSKCDKVRLQSAYVLVDMVRDILAYSFLTNFLLTF